jgi:hypothetical protein
VIRISAARACNENDKSQHEKKLKANTMVMNGGAEEGNIGEKSCELGVAPGSLISRQNEKQMRQI